MKENKFFKSADLIIDLLPEINQEKCFALKRNAKMELDQH